MVKTGEEVQTCLSSKAAQFIKIRINSACIRIPIVLIQQIKSTLRYDTAILPLINGYTTRRDDVFRSTTRQMSSEKGHDHEHVVSVCRNSEQFTDDNNRHSNMFCTLLYESGNDLYKL